MQNDNLAIGLPALETNYTLPERYSLHAGSQAESVSMTYDKDF